jgi:hypothetical protein
MNILILGGTQFLGRHFVEIALNNGYQITLFNRGQTNNSLYPNVEKLVGDRLNGNLAALRGRKWDIVIDTAGYFSQVLKQVNWYPESLYTVDICESEGELYVLELGSFSCAGEYGCDLSLIVEAGAKAAWEDYEAVNC